MAIAYSFISHITKFDYGESVTYISTVVGSPSVVTFKFVIPQDSLVASSSRLELNEILKLVFV